MDGNGRWAKARGKNRFFGHVRGAQVAKSIIEECARLGVEHLTLFAFSTENWFRPKDEVSFLMRLIARKLKQQRPLLIKNNIKFCVIGDWRRLPPSVRAEVIESVDITKSNTGMVLTAALSYGGRQEIVEMAKRLAQKTQLGEVALSDINEELVSQCLPSSFLPDPDLLIRTSGESRISNFFLWQMAYTEIFFEEEHWPDFTISRLREILSLYSHRERRFGRTTDQLEAIQ